MGTDVREKHAVWPQLNKGEDVMKKLAGHNILKDGYNNRSIATSQPDIMNGVGNKVMFRLNI